MVPEYWLTEGGQSATGALLDHVIENHVASALLANRAASRSELFFFFCPLASVKCYFDIDRVDVLNTNLSGSLSLSSSFTLTLSVSL